MWFSDKRKPQEESNLKNILIKFFLGLFIGLCVLVFYNFKYLDRIEMQTLDLRFKLKSPHKTNDNIAIIEISDDSVYALGRWPWPRSYHAALIDVLNKFGAGLIGFDIIFSESVGKEDDDIFIESLKQNPNVYLAFSFETKNGKLDPNSAILPPEPFIKYSKATAFINIEPDVDGKIRFANLFVKRDSSVDYSLSLKLALDFLGVDAAHIKIKDSLMEVALGNNKYLYIPITQDGRLLINWPGRWTETFKHYSFFDILQSYKDSTEGKTPVINLNELKDKICLVGVTATGLGDIKSVPIEPLYPGIGIHASIVSSILNNDFIEKTPDFLNILLIFALALGLPFLISEVRIFRGFLITILFILGFWNISFILFEKKNIWMNLVYPTVTIIFVYLVVTIYNELILSIERLRLFKASTIDGLTGLYNKTYFTFLLQAELAIMRMRKLNKLAIIMADIDHFKSVNDTFGHQIGDLILKEVSAVFKENSRPQDVVGRFGGEEIFMMLKNTDLGAAYQIAQRIRKVIEEREFKNEKDTYRITISMGVATYRVKDNDEFLVKRADEALYQAKNEGRNRVCQEKPASGD